MEYLSGSLAGILLWSSILHCVVSARKNARKQGGELLFSLERRRRSMLTKIGFILWLAFPLAIYFFLFVVVYNWAYGSRSFG
jgi:hypothetical protein